MELKKKSWKTVADMEALPEGTRAELIDGVIYDMAAPTIAHQEIVSFLTWKIRDYIYSKNGKCKVFPSPFDVQLDKDDYTLVQPDISVICDKDKLSNGKRCVGAPDWVIEVVSPSTSDQDYSLNNPARRVGRGFHCSRQDFSPRAVLESRFSPALRFS